MLKNPRISDVSKLKLVLVSAAYCFQSAPQSDDNDDDLDSEEVHALPCSSSTRLVFSSQEGDNDGAEEKDVFGSDVDNDGE